MTNEINKLFDIDESNRVYSEFLLDYLKYAKVIAKECKKDLLDTTYTPKQYKRVI